MWALEAKTCVRNRVNDAKFVNFNRAFLKKYHIAHHFSFKSSLANLLGIKITNFHQKHWLLIFKMVAQRYKGCQKFSIFTLVFYFRQQLLKDFVFSRGVNNFHEKNPWDVVAFLRNVTGK